MTSAAIGDAVPSPPGRLRPSLALQPGRRDASRLLAAWYVRKSAYWLLFVGTSAAYLTQRTNETIEWGDPGAVVSRLASPLFGLVLAAVVRVTTALFGLVMAYPIVRDYLGALEPRSGVGSGIGRILDQRSLLYAARRWRWSHHVRQEALRRLGPAGRRVGRIDPILDLLNIGTCIVMIVVVLTVGV